MASKSEVTEVRKSRAAAGGANPAVKPTRKPKSATPRKSAAQASEPVTSGKKDGKRKAKLIRDSFTMPEEDFVLIAQMKSRMLDIKRPVKKSELLRAGLQVLNALDDKALLQSIGRLMQLKAGRPKSGS